MSAALSLGGTVIGSEEVQKALTDFPSEVMLAVRSKFNSLATRVASQAFANISQVFDQTSSTGKLRSALYKSARKAATKVTMRVGIRKDVFYAPWQEFGTVPRDVQQRRGLLRSGKVRGSGVRHGWHLRPHPFLLPAWGEVAPVVQEELAETIVQEIARAQADRLARGIGYGA